MRDLGLSSALAPLVPEALVPLIAAITFLGSPTFLAVAAPLGSAIGISLERLERRGALRFLAIVFLAFGTSMVLKHALALPRPPATLHRVAEDGFGFPSGHVTAMTGVSLAAAALARWRTPRLRYSLAAIAIATIAATRVLLGVHYLVDTIAGAVVGAVAVWIGLSLSRRNLAATVGLVGVLLGAGLVLKFA